MRTASDILLTKPAMFNVIDPDTTIIDALQMMNSVNLSYLVVKKDNDFLGIFSERDYSRNVTLKGLQTDTATVKEAMSTSFPSVGMTETFESCMNLLNSHKTRYLLVFEKKQLRGVITIHDLLREVMNSREHVFDEYITLAIKESAALKGKIF
ncbi:MAG: CBS domain-containing protein [Lacibacter sp.]